MTFALTKFKAWGDIVDGVVPKRATQKVYMVITAATTDVALDFSDAAGTFWVACLADSVYGGLATKALSVIQNIDDLVENLHKLQCEELFDRIQAAATSGTAYTLTVSAHTPILTCAASNGETTWHIEIHWTMIDGALPVTANLG